MGPALPDSYWAKSSESTKQTRLVKVFCAETSLRRDSEVRADSAAGLGAGNPGTRLSILVEL
jgi:hypothetical protein